MRSDKPGKTTSVTEVTQVSRHGFWLLLPTGEVFLSFEALPWFRKATIGQIQNVTLLHSEHLYWPELDIDLAVESIHHPERYPLVTGTDPSTPPERPTCVDKISDAPRGKRRGVRR